MSKYKTKQCVTCGEASSGRQCFDCFSKKGSSLSKRANQRKKYKKIK